MSLGSNGWKTSLHAVGSGRHPGVERHRWDVLYRADHRLLPQLVERLRAEFRLADHPQAVLRVEKPRVADREALIEVSLLNEVPSQKSRRKFPVCVEHWKRKSDTRYKSSDRDKRSIGIPISGR